MPSVDVDLGHRAVAQGIRARFDELCNLADGMTRGPAGLFDPDQVNCDLGELTCATEAYFLLNEAYKVVRPYQSPDSLRRSLGPQKAALTAIALFAFEPLRPVDPTPATQSVASRTANLVLVLDFAMSIMGEPANALTEDMYLRLFRFLDHQVVYALEEYQADQMQRTFKSRYSIDLDRDLHIIDVLILFFQLHGGSSPNEDDD